MATSFTCFRDYKLSTEMHALVIMGHTIRPLKGLKVATLHIKYIFTAVVIIGPCGYFARYPWRDLCAYEQWTTEVLLTTTIYLT